MVLFLGAGACFVDDPVVTTSAAESCDTYCDLSLTYCQNGNLLFQHPDTCPNSCAALDANGSVGDTSGNTLQCRLTYLFAARKEPFVFCRDAALDSNSCR